MIYLKQFNCSDLPQTFKQFNCSDLPQTFKQFNCSDLPQTFKQFNCSDLPQTFKQFNHSYLPYTFNLAAWLVLPARFSATHSYSPPSSGFTDDMFTWLMTSPNTVTYWPIINLHTKKRQQNIAVTSGVCNIRHDSFFRSQLCLSNWDIQGLGWEKDLNTLKFRTLLEPVSGRNFDCICDFPAQIRLTLQYLGGLG